MLCGQCEVAKTADDEPISPSTVVLPERPGGHVPLHDLSHASITMDMLHRLWQDELLCDVTVRVQERRWRAHRALLAASSPYFRTMFTSDYIEKEEAEIQLNGFESDVFDSVLKYMYTGYIELSGDSVAAVLDATEHLQLSALRHHCLQYLGDAAAADTATAVTVWRLARLHRAADLERRALRLICDCFSVAARDPDFLVLSEREMADLLTASYVNAKEDQILYALCRWTEADAAGRQPAFRRLLRCLSVTQLDPFKLRTATEIHECLQDPEVRSFLESRQPEPPSVRDDSPTEGGGDVLPTAPVQRCTDSLEVVLAIGGATCAGFSSGVECLARGYDSWKYSVPRAVSAVSGDVIDTEPMARLEEMRSFAAAAADDDSIYVIGGLRDLTSLTSCERYSVRDNQFSRLPDLPGRLHGAAACVAGGQLLLLGGSLDGTVTSRVWTYCSEQRAWRERASMPVARSHHCAAVLRGHVYAVGGIDAGGAYLSAVCRYDPDNDRWTVAPPCGSPRAYAACAVVGDQLYLIGGHSGRQWLKTVRRFSPLENQWHGLGAMPETLGQLAATVCDNRIYCVGGFSGCDYRRTVHKYNPRTDRWHSELSLHIARWALAAATVRVPVTRGSDV
ncbi:kelch-like protein 20 [Amphibalanus amphitrite]|uniref:kelch-like protein 20 n=1 Tax=Amphibalanus amphitrite TaxID=1232801 RepID=UPI001C8FB696|nr:kelch-like protein 20 [Amphibalanus amphitrite]